MEKFKIASIVNVSGINCVVKNMSENTQPNRKYNYWQFPVLPIYSYYIVTTSLRPPIDFKIRICASPFQVLAAFNESSQPSARWDPLPLTALDSEDFTTHRRMSARATLKYSKLSLQNVNGNNSCADRVDLFSELFSTLLVAK